MIKLATDAGFKLDAKSEINANPKDTKDYPKGVWTLPPTLALRDKDQDKYLAIGESDRMTLRFVKPGGDQIFKAPRRGEERRQELIRHVRLTGRPPRAAVRVSHGPRC